MMKTKGKSGPAKTGPSPFEAKSVTALFCIDGCAIRMPTARRAIVPIFMKVER